MTDKTAALREFARWAASQSCYDGYEVTGDAVERKAMELGLLAPVNMTEPCGEFCGCADRGDWPQTCYRLALGDERASTPVLDELAMKVGVGLTMGRSYIASERYDDAANVMRVVLEDIAADLAAEMREQAPDPAQPSLL